VTQPGNGQPPPPYDPYNQYLGPQVDAFDVRAFLPPDGQTGVLGLTVLTATGESTLMASKAKLARVIEVLQQAHNMVPEPSGLILPGANEAVTRMLREEGPR
jgi:hypothetical protein